MAVPVQTAAAQPPDFVPVEHRFLGIDRRTIVPAVVVLLIAIFMHTVLPNINEKIEYEKQTKAGDVVDLGAQQLTIAAAAGWNAESALLVTESKNDAAIGATSTLSFGDTSFSVITGPFEGTADELLDQINKVNDDLDDKRGLGVATQRVTIHTASGLVGVLEGFDDVKGKSGVVATFVIPDYLDGGSTTSVGIQVQVIGSTATVNQKANDIALMIASLKYEPTPEESKS